MKKKFICIICGISIALCMLTGCSSNTGESQTSSNVSGLDSKDAYNKPHLPPDKNKQPEELTDEKRVALDAFNTLAKEIASKYEQQIQELIGQVNAEIQSIYEQVLGEQYVELKNEYDGLYSQYQSLVQGFYNDENYIALKNELNAKIQELSALVKGSEEYNAKLIEINSIWSQISVLAGEVNSQLTVLCTRAIEIEKQIISMAASQKEELNALTEPIVSKYAANVKSIKSAFMQEIELLKQILGLA